MTLFHERNNHYTVNDVAGWPALFQRLQESSGQPIVDIAHAYCYDVSGVGDPKHFYDIRIQSSSVDNHSTTYLSVDLGGKSLINDPMHNLRSAEELVETMITLRAFNTTPGNIFRGEEQIALDGRLKDPAETALSTNAEVQRYAFEVGESTINNFFQIYDTLSWLETVGAFQAEHGHNLDSGEVISIKTSREGIETGIYTVQKVIIGDKAGVQVNQDGHPFWNYGKPQTSTAEQVVALIEKLRKNFGSIPLGKEFNFNPANEKPLVASVRTDSGTVVQMFANGTIVIQHPGIINMLTPEASVLVQSLADAVESNFDAPGCDVDE